MRPESNKSEVVRPKSNEAQEPEDTVASPQRMSDYVLDGLCTRALNRSEHEGKSIRQDRLALDLRDCRAALRRCMEALHSQSCKECAQVLAGSSGTGSGGSPRGAAAPESERVRGLVERARYEAGYADHDLAHFLNVVADALEAREDVIRAARVWRKTIRHPHGGHHVLNERELVAAVDALDASPTEGERT